MLEDERTACTHAVFVSSCSLIVLDWMALPIVWTQGICIVYGDSACMRSNVFRVSNVILQIGTHKKPRISEMEQAIDVKLGATLVV